MLSTPSSVTPSGFTQIDTRTWTTSGDGVRQCISLKVADGTEASASISGMGGGAPRKSLAVYRPDKSIVEFSTSVLSANEEDTTSNPAAQTVTASDSSRATISFAMGNGTSSVTTVSLTSEDVNSGSFGAVSFYCSMSYTGQTPTNVNLTADMGDEGENYLFSGYVEVY